MKENKADVSFNEELFGEKLFEDRNFGIFRMTDEAFAQERLARSCSKNMCAAVLCLDGECQCGTGKKSFKLKAHDAAFFGMGVSHTESINPNKGCDRIVLYIGADFFKDKVTEKYLKLCGEPSILVFRAEQNNMKIETPESCIRRIYRYCNFGGDGYDIAQNCIIEFLYLADRMINTGDASSAKDAKSQHKSIADRKPVSAVIYNDGVRNIKRYIEEHFMEDLNLDDLSKRFYISKNHMCAMFKKNTGSTINEYINRRRLKYVDRLCAEGETLLSASIDAGFKCYSSFYRAYKKQNGVPPKDGKIGINAMLYEKNA